MTPKSLFDIRLTVEEYENGRLLIGEVF